MAANTSKSQNLNSIATNTTTSTTTAATTLNTTTNTTNSDKSVTLKSTNISSTQSKTSNLNSNAIPHRKAISVNSNLNKMSGSTTGGPTNTANPANKSRNLTQRHSLATMTMTSTMNAAETPSTANVDSNSQVKSAYKTNFTNIAASTVISSPNQLMPNTNRFYSGQTKFRTNLKKMKELDIPLNTPIVSSTSISIPLNQLKKTSSPDENEELLSQKSTRWYLDESELNMTPDIKSNKKQHRKLLPINKANVQQISATASNSSISAGTSVIFFNKLSSSSSSKNVKVGADSSSKQPTSNAFSNSYLELDPSANNNNNTNISNCNASPRTSKNMPSPKNSTAFKHAKEKRLSEPLVFNTFISPIHQIQQQQPQPKINSTIKAETNTTNEARESIKAPTLDNLKLQEKALLKHKSLQFNNNLRKTQSVTNNSGEVTNNVIGKKS